MILLFIGRGYGILVLPIVIFSLLITYITVTGWTSNADYMRLHIWTLGVSLIVSGASCWQLDRWLRGRTEHLNEDPKTDPRNLRKGTYPTARFDLKPRPRTESQGTFFFIPLHYWVYIFGLLGIVFIACDFGSAVPTLPRDDSTNHALPAYEEPKP